jgi:hypothetical protein
MAVQSVVPPVDNTHATTANDRIHVVFADSTWQLLAHVRNPRPKKLKNQDNPEGKAKRTKPHSRETRKTGSTSRMHI